MARGHARVLVLGQARNCSLLVRLRRCVTCSARGQGFQPFDASEEGAWEELPGGGAAWRLTVRSPGALSHVLVFRCARPVFRREGCITGPLAWGRLRQLGSPCVVVRPHCAWWLPCLVSPSEPPCLYVTTINPVQPVPQADRAHCHDPPVPRAASPAHACARLRGGGPRGRPRQQGMPHGGRPGR